MIPRSSRSARSPLSISIPRVHPSNPSPPGLSSHSLPYIYRAPASCVSPSPCLLSCLIDRSLARVGSMGEPADPDVLFHGGEVDGGSTEAGLSSGGGGSTGSLCSSTWSNLTDDDGDTAGSSTVVVGSAFSSSSSSDTMHLDGEDDGRGPLYELSPLLEHLPIRTGLSKFYRGKSQSFASLSDAKCIQDLGKQGITYSSRMRERRVASRSSSAISRHTPGLCSKTIAKKATPKGSSDRMILRARSTGILHSIGKPPVCQINKELCGSNIC